MDFVKQAITMDEMSRTKLMDQMQKVTELDNPNSVQQMKGWLSENGVETDTLGKKAVVELLKDAPEHRGKSSATGNHLLNILQWKRRSEDCGMFLFWANRSA